jgi:CcmD family protein
MTVAQETKTVADRSTEFVAVQGGEETSNASGLLTAAYVIMWLTVFAFVFFTSRRLGRMKRRVDDLETALRKADASSRAS